MDFTDDTSASTSHLSVEEAFPAPTEATPEQVAKYNERYLQANPRAAARTASQSDGDPTVQLPTSKAIDTDDTRFKSEYPWLFDPAKGVRWDFDPIELRVLSQENAWVGMLVQTITKEIAETSWTISEVEDLTETQKRLTTYPDARDPVSKELPDGLAEDIFELLMSPSPDHDWYDLVEMWMADLLEIGSLTGVKAYRTDAYNDDDELVVDAGSLTPRAIMPTAPEVWTKDYSDKSGVIDGYWQFDNHSTPGVTASRTRGVGNPIHFDRAEIVWSDMAPRTNRRYGTPPTLLVNEFLQSLDLAVTQEQQYLSRGSIPSGAWVMEEWDRETVKEWKAENAENIKGKPHKSLFFAGEGGSVSFEPMSMNFKELEFTERMRWYARIVASAFQVPTAVVGIEPEKVNYATFQGERENFESNTLGPYLQQLERVINSQIVEPHWGRDYRFEFTPGMSETTRKMISDRVGQEFSNNLTTRNEARREIGRDPVDDELDGFKDEVVDGSEDEDDENPLAGLSLSVDKAEYDVGDETIDLTPPDYMVAAAEAAADAGDRGVIPADCGTGVGDRRRDQIINDEIGPDVVDEIATYLTSHAEDVTADGTPSEWTDDEWADGCGNAQYAKWGGTGDGRAMEWAQQKSDRVAELRGEEPTYKGLGVGSEAESNPTSDFRKAEADSDDDAPLRNTDDWAMFDVQPADIERLHDEIRDDVGALYQTILEDEDIQRLIDQFATAKSNATHAADTPDEATGSDATEKSLTGLARRISELLSGSDVAQRLTDAVESARQSEIRAAIEAAAAEEDDGTDIDIDPIMDAVVDRELGFADRMVDRVSDEVRQAVADGWADGKNSLEIRDDIADAAGAAEDWGTERIARQELQIAAGQARNAYAAETNRVEVWTTSGDDRVREPHANMDGAWKRPGELFRVDYSAVDRGVQTEKVPGDSEPGIGCRCFTQLVDIDEVDPDDHAGVS